MLSEELYLQESHVKSYFLLSVSSFLFFDLEWDSKILSFILQQKFFRRMLVLHHNTYFSTSSQECQSSQASKSDDSSLFSSSTVRSVTTWRWFESFKNTSCFDSCSTTA